MISEKELAEIRDWLHRSQNPVFFFDNDVDGLSSFLLLRRYINTGKGVAIKNPSLNNTYARKLHELKPDVVFILDIPIVDKDFLDECKQLGMPVVRIDHHPIEEASKNDENVHYYDPLANKEASSEPVSYWCYKVTKKDEWIAMAGCISDWFVPDFAEEFEKNYSDIFELKKPEEILFETEFGKLIRILNFALKDSTSNVIKMLKILWDVKDPYEILQENKKYEDIRKRYEHLKKKYDLLLEKAIDMGKKEKGKLFYFEYGSDFGMSADLANELLYLFKEKEVFVIARVKDSIAKVSIRGRGNRDMRKLVENALNGTGGKGGGHEHACGVTIGTDDLKKFKKNIEEILKD